MSCPRGVARLCAGSSGFAHARHPSRTTARIDPALDVPSVALARATSRCAVANPRGPSRESPPGRLWSEQREGEGSRTPSRRRVLSDEPVHGFTKQVGMSRVAAVLLDQVADEPTQAGVLTVRRRDVDQLIEATISKGPTEPRPGATDGATPDGVQILWRVGAGRTELPLLVVVPVDGTPRCTEWRSTELHGERVVLGDGQVLEQTAKCEGRVADPGR
jgi:hypothetical protein